MPPGPAGRAGRSRRAVQRRAVSLVCVAVAGAERPTTESASRRGFAARTRRDRAPAGACVLGDGTPDCCWVSASERGGGRSGAPGETRARANNQGGTCQPGTSSLGNRPFGDRGVDPETGGERVSRVRRSGAAGRDAAVLTEADWASRLRPRPGRPLSGRPLRSQPRASGSAGHSTAPCPARRGASRQRPRRR